MLNVSVMLVKESKLSQQFTSNCSSFNNNLTSSILLCIALTNSIDGVIVVTIKGNIQGKI